MKNRIIRYNRPYNYNLNYFFNDASNHITYSHFIVGGTLKEEYIKYIKHLYEE